MIFKEWKLGYLVSVLVAGVLLTGCGSEAYIDKGNPAYIEVVEDILGNANSVPASAEQINSLDGVSGAVDGIDYSEILQQGEYVDRTHPTFEEIQEAINSAVPALRDFAGTINEDELVGTVVGNINIVRSGVSAITAFTLNDSSTFAIDSNGQITTKVALDYETTSSYALTVTATNSAGESAPVEINITVINTNTAPTASDFNMTLGTNKSSVMADWNVSSSATDIDGDMLTAIVKTQGSYGTFVVIGNTLTYSKTTESNITDTGVLEISDGRDVVEITVKVKFSNWKYISAGIYHTVAIKSDGTLWAWGYNGSGQLGDGTTTSKSVPTQESTNATDWNTVGTGGHHTVATKSDGTLWAWGDNSIGQLGDGTTTNRLIPTQESTNATDWNSVGAGFYHTVATKSDGTLWAWGDNSIGQLGDGTATLLRSVPTQESTNATDWNSVGAGFYHTVATKSDGTLWAWGRNDEGELGDTTTTHRPVPTQESTNATDWSSVSGKGHHTVAIKSDGTLWAWGYNVYGQLGDGTTTNRLIPTQESTNATDWNSVGAGGYHTAAIKSDGTLWAWGYNDSGQLGDGTTTDNPVPTQESTNATDWSFVGAGGYHNIAVKSNDSLWAWGANWDGQLGDGTIVDRYVPTQVIGTP